MIKFDEYMNGDGTWYRPFCNSDVYDYCEKFKAYCNSKYDVYFCWNKGKKDYGYLYRVVKNKCSKCGQEIK